MVCCSCAATWTCVIRSSPRCAHCWSCARKCATRSTCSSSRFRSRGSCRLMVVWNRCDAVGAIPHCEMTRAYGEESVRVAISLAADHDKLVDIHCDETDDEQSRFLEVMIAETVRLGMSGHVTASHTTAMHSYNNAYAYR